MGILIADGMKPAWYSCGSRTSVIGINIWQTTLYMDVVPLENVPISIRSKEGEWASFLTFRTNEASASYYIRKETKRRIPFTS